MLAAQAAYKTILDTPTLTPEAAKPATYAAAVKARLVASKTSVKLPVALKPSAKVAVKNENAAPAEISVAEMERRIAELQAAKALKEVMENKDFPSGQTRSGQTSSK